jgi:malonyl-CoA O-methyltransferase
MLAPGSKTWHSSAVQNERKMVSVAEGYSNWAPLYDSYANALIMIEEPLVRGLVGDVRGKRVLDVACGTGRHAIWLDAMGADVTGVDQSPQMLAIARAKPSNVRWLEGDVAKLPAADASFDVVVNALVMEHLPEIGPAIAEAHRVLAPGGSFVLSVYHPFFLFKGIPPHFKKERDGQEYELPSYVHYAADYVTAVLRLGMKLTDLLEPLVDDALVARLPKYQKHHGSPLAIVLRATKP